MIICVRDTWYCQEILKEACPIQKMHPVIPISSRQLLEESHTQAACFNNGYYPGVKVSIFTDCHSSSFRLLCNRTDTRSFPCSDIQSFSCARSIWHRQYWEVNLSGRKTGKRTWNNIWLHEGCSRKFKIQITQWEKQSGGQGDCIWKMEGTLTQVTASGKKKW